MIILGIESASLVASVAIVRDDILVAEYTVNHKKTHSQTLLPMLDEIVRMTEQELGEIDGIAISGGPGSFTGLRIGSATAKGLGLALGKPLIHVPTVDAMAFNFFGCRHLICPIMDARRNQVYTGIYRYDTDFEVLHENEAMAIEDLLALLREYEDKVIFLGDGVPVQRRTIEAQLGDRAVFAPPQNNRQRAASVAALGAKLFAEGRTETADEHTPLYLRMSQAEREYVTIEELSRAAADGELLKTLSELAGEYFRDGWNADQIRSGLHNPGMHILVAKHKEEPVGYSILQTVLDEGELLMLAVAPDYRKQGIGTRLVQEGEKRFPEVCTWNLEVRQSNGPAIGCYKKNGYQELYLRRDYYRDPKEDAVCMQKER